MLLCLNATCWVMDKSMETESASNSSYISHQPEAHWDRDSLKKKSHYIYEQQCNAANGM
jgi:hypothetical protein